MLLSRSVVAAGAPALLVGSLTLLASAAHAQATDAHVVDSKISEVTVYADRARVTRESAVNLAQGRQRIALEHLPGWVDEGSVRVSLTGATGTQILDVRLDKTFLARASAEDVRAAENDVQAITDEMASLDDELGVLNAEKAQIESVRAFATQQLPADTLVRDVKVETFKNTVDFVAARLRENSKQRREILKKKRELAPELAARQRKLNDVRAKSQLQERTVVVDLDAVGRTRGTLTVTYMLPGATWEPTAELRASDGAEHITLSSYAVVTQTTGEDWSGAEIHLSTQRPSATMRLPELEGLLVAGGASLVQAVGPSAETFQRAQNAYAAGNTLLTRGLDYHENLARQLAVQQRVSAAFDALAQRGTTAHYDGGTQTIRADGRPVRVAIGSDRLAADYRILAAPELTLNAARTVDLVNTGSQPLLPGRVSLYVNGSFLGTTENDFVAQGEKFSMFVGVADRIKLARTLDKKRSSVKRFGKRTKLQVSYLVTAENLSEYKQTVALSDRVPVSQISDVKVDKVRIEPSVEPDRQGLLKWERTLSPKQKQAFRIEYTIEYPTALLAQARMQRQMNPAKAATPDMFDEIDRIESNL